MEHWALRSEHPTYTEMAGMLLSGESRSLGQSGRGQIESTMVGIALDPDQYMGCVDISQLLKIRRESPCPIFLGEMGASMDMLAAGLTHIAGEESSGFAVFIACTSLPPPSPVCAGVRDSDSVLMWSMHRLDPKDNRKASGFRITLGSPQIHEYERPCSTSRRAPNGLSGYACVIASEVPIQAEVPLTAPLYPKRDSVDGMVHLDHDSDEYGGSGVRGLSYGSARPAWIRAKIADSLVAADLLAMIGIKVGIIIMIVKNWSAFNSVGNTNKDLQLSVFVRFGIFSVMIWAAGGLAAGGSRPTRVTQRPSPTYGRLLCALALNMALAYLSCLDYRAYSTRSSSIIDDMSAPPPAITDNAPIKLFYDTSITSKIWRHWNGDPATTKCGVALRDAAAQYAADFQGRARIFALMPSYFHYSPAESTDSLPFKHVTIRVYGEDDYAIGCVEWAAPGNGMSKRWVYDAATVVGYMWACWGVVDNLREAKHFFVRGRYSEDWTKTQLHMMYFWDLWRRYIGGFLSRSTCRISFPRHWQSLKRPSLDGQIGSTRVGIALDPGQYMVATRIDQALWRRTNVAGNCCRLLDWPWIYKRLALDLQRSSPYNHLLAFLAFMHPPVLFELQHDEWFKAIPAEYLLELDDAGDLMDTRLVPAPVDGIPLLELDDEGEIIQESVVVVVGIPCLELDDHGEVIRETFLPEDKSSDSDSDTESEVSLAPGEVFRVRTLIILPNDNKPKVVYLETTQRGIICFNDNRELLSPMDDWLNVFLGPDFYVFNPQDDAWIIRHGDDWLMVDMTATLVVAVEHVPDNVEWGQFAKEVFRT
ncbi:hypothetical protein BDZ89DRAFT_1036132 [Hymenopellis radicata]|nr:hypothetical protein BDZ89DRAFT_1036132 [Hymenopellis radicata]